MTPMEEIQAERERQINVEGWSRDHDDMHGDGSMLKAAVIYMWHGTERASPMQEDGRPMGWPWLPSHFKPKDRRRNLVRAGALCLAEKERIERREYRFPQMDMRVRGRRAYVTPDIKIAASHVDQKLEIIVRELTALGAA